MKNNIVVYTCITNGYDDLNEILNKEDNIDYICFTDDKTLTSKTWTIIYINDKNLDNLTNVKKQRYIKINPHLFLSDYEISIWIDGNMSIIGDINQLLKIHNNEYFMTTLKHPYTNCIYIEAKKCADIKDSSLIIFKQVFFKYLKEKYPINNGLIESRMIIRNHNNNKCIKLMEDWWKEVNEYSHRDQLSFNYVLWKNNLKIGLIEAIDIDSFFKMKKGHKKNSHKNLFF